METMETYELALFRICCPANEGIFSSSNSLFPPRDEQTVEQNQTSGDSGRQARRQAVRFADNMVEHGSSGTDKASLDGQDIAVPSKKSDGITCQNLPPEQVTSACDAKEKSAMNSGSKMTSCSTQTVEFFDANASSQLSSVFNGEWPIATGQRAVPSSVAQEISSVMSFNSCMTSSPRTSRRTQPHQLGTKVEMVYTLLSLLGPDKKDDMSKTFLSLSSSQQSCIAMRQSGCLPLLIQILHSTERLQNPSPDNDPQRHHEERQRASQTLHNIIHAHVDDKKGRREARVLRFLEHVRAYCDQLMLGAAKENKSILNDSDTDQQPGPSIAALMKLSFDKEHRHTMCELGGLQAIAELLQLDHETFGNTRDHNCILIRHYAGMALTNLTFGDGTNKALLCSMNSFMQALVAQLYSPSEDLRQVTASVLRNLSWRADPSSKQVLRNIGAVTVLMKAAMEATKEQTLRSILSALWNLSAHCSANKADICSVEGALAFLVSTLTYKSPTKSLAIIENGGGVLRNVSSHIAVREDYRSVLRKHNCLQVLLQHLKSPSLTVVSNACGTLWNLSARCAEDQKLLWELGAVDMIRNLVHSKHKMIAMGSSATLKNLLQAKPSLAVCNENDPNSLNVGRIIPLQDQNADVLRMSENPDVSKSCTDDDSMSLAREAGVSNSDIFPLAYQYYEPSSRSYDNFSGCASEPVSGSESDDSIGSAHSEPTGFQEGSTSLQVFHKNQALLKSEFCKLPIANPSVRSVDMDGIQTHSVQSSTHLGPHHEISPTQTYNVEKTTTAKNSYLKDSDSCLAIKQRLSLHDFKAPITGVTSGLKDGLEAETMEHIKRIVLKGSSYRFQNYASLAEKIERFEENHAPDQPTDYSLIYSEKPPLDQSPKGCKPQFIEEPIQTKIYHLMLESSQESGVITHSKSYSPKAHCDLWKVPTDRPNMLSNPSALCCVPSASASLQEAKRSFDSIYDSYAETDLDQPTDYSLVYNEDMDTTEDYRHVKVPEADKKFFPLPENVPFQGDTVKVYCTEDTPLNFSMASSLCDLRELPAAVQTSFNSLKGSDPDSPANKDENEVIKNKAVLANRGNEEAVGKNDVPYEQHAMEKSNSALKRRGAHPDKEGKTVTFGEDINYAKDTPLMFSRCSSLGSLSSFEQHSIHDDRSSVISDFSRRTSEVVSPSDLPDSPGQSAPSSPKQTDEKGKHNFAMTLENNLGEDSRVDTQAASPDKEGLIIHKEACEGNLSKESDGDGESIQVISSSNIDVMPRNYNDMAIHFDRLGVSPVHAKGSRIPVRVNMMRSTNSAPHMTKPCNTVLSSAQYEQDSIKVYQTEGTPPMLSHATSLSDLSINSTNDHHQNRQPINLCNTASESKSISFCKESSQYLRNGCNMSMPSPSKYYLEPCSSKKNKEAPLLNSVIFRSKLPVSELPASLDDFPHPSCLPLDSTQRTIPADLSVVSLPSKMQENSVYNISKDLTEHNDTGKKCVKSPNRSSFLSEVPHVYEEQGTPMDFCHNASLSSFGDEEGKENEVSSRVAQSQCSLSKVQVSSPPLVLSQSRDHQNMDNKDCAVSVTKFRLHEDCDIPCVFELEGTPATFSRNLSLSSLEVEDKDQGEEQSTKRENGGLDVDSLQMKAAQSVVSSRTDLSTNMGNDAFSTSNPITFQEDKSMNSSHIDKNESNSPGDHVEKSTVENKCKMENNSCEGGPEGSDDELSPSEQALLEEFIKSGMPKPRQSSGRKTNASKQTASKNIQRNLIQNANISIRFPTSKLQKTEANMKQFHSSAHNPTCLIARVGVPKDSKALINPHNVSITQVDHCEKIDGRSTSHQPMIMNSSTSIAKSSQINMDMPSEPNEQFVSNPSPKLKISLQASRPTDRTFYQSIKSNLAALKSKLPSFTLHSKSSDHVSPTYTANFECIPTARSSQEYKKSSMSGQGRSLSADGRESGSKTNNIDISRRRSASGVVTPVDCSSRPVTGPGASFSSPSPSASDSKNSSNEDMRMDNPSHMQNVKVIKAEINLQQCDMLLRGPNKGILGTSASRSSSPSIRSGDSSDELTAAEKELLEKCIQAGMPKPKPSAQKSSKTSSTFERHAGQANSSKTNNGSHGTGGDTNSAPKSRNHLKVSGSLVPGEPEVPLPVRPGRNTAALGPAAPGSKYSRVTEVNANAYGNHSSIGSQMKVVKRSRHDGFAGSSAVLTKASGSAFTIVEKKSEHHSNNLSRRNLHGHGYDQLLPQNNITWQANQHRMTGTKSKLSHASQKNSCVQMCELCEKPSDASIRPHGLMTKLGEFVPSKGRTIPTANADAQGFPKKSFYNIRRHETYQDVHGLPSQDADKHCVQSVSKLRNLAKQYDPFHISKGSPENDVPSRNYQPADCDSPHVYEVEGTPVTFSRSDSLSSINSGGAEDDVDLQESTRNLKISSLIQSPEILSTMARPVTGPGASPVSPQLPFSTRTYNCKANERESKFPKNREFLKTAKNDQVQGYQRYLEDRNFSSPRNSPVDTSTESVEELTLSEQALLDELIEAGMPKPRNSKGVKGNPYPHGTTGWAANLLPEQAVTSRHSRSGDALPVHSLQAVSHATSERHSGRKSRGSNIPKIDQTKAHNPNRESNASRWTTNAVASKGNPILEISANRTNLEQAAPPSYNEKLEISRDQVADFLKNKGNHEITGSALSEHGTKDYRDHENKSSVKLTEVAGRLAGNQKPHFAREPSERTHNKKGKPSSKQGLAKPADVENGTRVEGIKDTQEAGMSKNSSLGDLSLGDSSGELSPSEQALLEECIKAGMPQAKQVRRK